MAPHSDEDVARSNEQSGIITTVFLALAWSFVLLRIWTRTCLMSNFGWDDATMIFACLIFSLYCGAVLYIQANGGGTHVTSVPHLQRLTRWVVISESAYVMAMMVLKISLGIFFARIVVKRWHFLLIYVTVGLNILSSIAAFFYIIFRCGPNIDDYVLNQLTGKCTPIILDLVVSYQQAASTTLTDLVFVILPGLILWNANMTRRSKLSAGVILGLATAGCICSILRFRYVEGLTRHDDFFWHAVNIGIWSSIECGTCIIAGCLATLRPLVIRVFRQTCGISVLSSCVRQLSRSFKSSRYSTSTTFPRHKNTASSATTSDIGGQKKGNTQDDLTCLEFLALPGQEVIQLGSDFGKERASTDRIFEVPDLPEIEFPWPMRSPTDRRRQTIHANWTVSRGVGSDGRTSHRRSSEPISPSLPVPPGFAV